MIKWNKTIIFRETFNHKAKHSQILGNFTLIRQSKEKL